MSYLAIARKYRPATFADIVGQEHVTRTLSNAITRDRVHHAFLFCGARGVGKTTAARALAKSLNCAEGPTPTPCGTCTSCKEIDGGNSPDLIEIDGASNNSVDDVRELRDTVHYAPTQGRRKIYLIDEVHMLSNAAFNALLKTLEEPPPHVVFLFATTEPGKIPDTILSRVQRFDFKRIPVTGVVTRLGEIAAREGASISETGLRMIARAGEGSMRDAQSLLDKVISFADAEIDDQTIADTLGLIDRGLLHRMLKGMLQADPAECFDVIATVYEFGHEMARFTEELLELLRDATFVQLSKEAAAHVDLPAEEIATLQELVERRRTRPAEPSLHRGPRSPRSRRARCPTTHRARDGRGATRNPTPSGSAARDREQARHRRAAPSAERSLRAERVRPAQQERPGSPESSDAGSGSCTIAALPHPARPGPQLRRPGGRQVGCISGGPAKAGSPRHRARRSDPSSEGRRPRAHRAIGTPLRPGPKTRRVHRSSRGARHLLR